MRLLQGNAFAELPKFADKQFDLVLTDPPYNFQQEHKEILQEEFLRVGKQAIVFSPPENPWPLPADQHLFWIKPISTKNTSRKYSRFVELIHVYGKGKWNCRHWSQHTNVFSDLVDKTSEHPFEKPYSMMKRLVLNHTNEGDTVLDPFFGSGVVAKVCRDFGRDFTGVEYSSNWFNTLSQEMRDE
jgi:DNA modification methylase